MRQIQLPFCVQNESLWPLCDSQQNLNRQRQRKDLLSIYKLSDGKVLSASKLRLGWGDDFVIELLYQQSRVQVFRLDEWEFSNSELRLILYESQDLEGSRCKIKCINLFCAHTRRSVANSLWRASQFFKSPFSTAFLIPLQNMVT